MKHQEKTERLTTKTYWDKGYEERDAVVPIH